MPDTISPEAAKQAQELLDKKLVTPLDDLSQTSVVAVADAAETVAMAKLQAATRAAEAAREAMARVAAMKAAAAAPPVPPVASEPAKLAPAPEIVSTPLPAPVAAVPETPAPGPVLVKETKNVEPPQATDERRVADRRNEQPRRAAPERRVESQAVEQERRAEFRRMSLGRRTDDPSGVVRLANAIRASSSEQADRRRSVSHDEEIKRPGSVIEPVARKAGHGPRSVTGAQHRVFTPQLIGMMILMGLFGMYATGNLPQFDQWTDSMVNKAHANNDVVVGTIVRNWHAEAFMAMGVLLVIMVLLVWNSLRARESD